MTSSCTRTRLAGTAENLDGLAVLFGVSRDDGTVVRMNALVFQLCVSAVAGWVNRGQQQVIEYLVEENRILREQLGGQRLRLTDVQRRRLAVRAEALGRKALIGIAWEASSRTTTAKRRDSWAIHF